MIVSLIVATSHNGAIGKDNKLPWSLPAEMALFRQTTKGCPVIMGRKTHESIGRALPGRQNIVITRDPYYQAAGCEVAASLKQAISIAKNNHEIFIIGGASIYDMAMPIADKVYLTRVDADVDGDKFFNFDKSNWKMIKSEKYKADNDNKYGFEAQQWVRK